MTKYQKNRAALLILAAALLLTAGGCKKESTEMIASEETAASETMASETSAAPGSDEEAVIELEPAVENAASGTASSGSLPSTLGLKTGSDTVKSNNVSLTYPTVEYPDDADKEDALNGHIRENALSWLAASGVNEADSAEITSEVLYADKSRITIVYKGQSETDGTSTRHFFTNTIDVEMIEDLGLTDFASPSHLADYARSGDCVYSDTGSGTKAMAAQFVKRMSEDTLAALFQQADFPFSGNLPSVFSYESDGDIYFSIPVSASLGDYVIAVYTPENK